MKKFALEIRTSTVDTREICAWFCEWFNTQEELDERLDLLWKLRECYKNSHIAEIEWKGYK